MIRPERVYYPLFLVGSGALVVGMTLGLYDSLSTRHRLPVLSLTEIVGTYLVEIESLIEEGEPEQAAEQAELALKLLHRDQHLTRNALGRARLLQDRLDEAAEQFLLALEEEPEFAEAHNNLGIVYARQGKMDQAVGEVRQALRIDPELQPALDNLMRMQARLDAAGAPAEPGFERGNTGEGEDLSSGRFYVRLFYRGELEQLRSNFSEGFAARMTPDELRELHRLARVQLGPEAVVLEERVDELEGARLYVRRARFAGHDGEVEVLVQLNDLREVSGLMLQPAE